MEPAYQQFVPLRSHTKREVETVINESAKMAQDYMRHYPEIRTHMDRYVAIREGIWAHSSTMKRDDTDDFWRAIAVAIGGGCFILRPDLALYLMRVDIQLYIRCISGYLTNQGLEPSRLHLSNSLVSTFLVSVGRDLTRNDHFSYARGLLDDLPIHSAHKDDIWDTVVTQLTNNPVPPRRAH
jgi:hypothetical protein